MKSLGITPQVAYFDTLIDGWEAGAASTTSNHVYCAGAKAIMLSFTAADLAGSREATLTVEVNNDNSTTYHAYNMLISNATNTNEQGLTRVTGGARSTNGTTLFWFTPETLGAISRFRVKLTRNTEGSGGTFTIKSSVVY